MSTNNFLFNFNVKEENNETVKYATPTRRMISGFIDCFIVLILRAFFLQTLNNSYTINFFNNFIDEFEKNFGTRTPKGTTEHVAFIMNHSIFIYALIIFFVTIFIGTLYHAYFNSSNWQATIGKRIAGIAVVKRDSQKISFMTGIYHYFLSLSFVIFIIFVLIYSQKNKYDIYELFSKNHFLTIFGLFLLIATHGNAFSKKRINLFDYLAKIEFHLGRTENKMPWTKIDK
jgi:uncharacterized RDD family membrane protein YckC